MNTIPRLLKTLRPTLAEVAAWVKVSRSLADGWRAGAYQPHPANRAALVQATRQHAKRLLGLANTVEREGGIRKR